MLYFILLEIELFPVLKEVRLQFVVPKTETIGTTVMRPNTRLSYTIAMFATDLDVKHALIAKPLTDSTHNNDASARPQRIAHAQRAGDRPSARPST